VAGAPGVPPLARLNKDTPSAQLSFTSHNYRGRSASARAGVEDGIKDLSLRMPLPFGRIGRMRILVVEDHKDTRDFVEFLLRRLGHEVLLAANGKEAVVSAVNKSPDLVMMDINMPEVDGLQAVAALRAIAPLRNVPIVAITAHYPTDFRETALAAGFTEYLQKPLTIEGITETLKKVCAA
jgi:CheY-like chemotaxis protein